MKRYERLLYDLPPLLLAWVATGLTVAQVALAFFFYTPAPDALKWAGWLCLWTSAIFGVVPIFTLRRKGGVAKGDSYMKTTRLVDSGIYAVVRHPQGGTAWLLINLGVMLIAAHWTSTLLGLLAMALAYADTFKADRAAIETFGEPYRRYMARVPRVDFVTGLIRLVRRR